MVIRNYVFVPTALFRAALLLAILVATFSMTAARANNAMNLSNAAPMACAMMMAKKPHHSGSHQPSDMPMTHCSMACLALVSAAPRVEVIQKMLREPLYAAVATPLLGVDTRLEIPPPKA